MRVSIRIRTLLVLGCLCTAAALAGAACTGSEDDTAADAAAEPAATAGAGSPSTPTAAVPPANEPAAVGPADEMAGALEVATRFLEAVSAFDADKAVSYLADVAAFSGLLGPAGPHVSAVGDLRMHFAVLKAGGFKRMFYPCTTGGVQDSANPGIELRCRYEYQALGSEEVGLGPYSGSFLDLTVRDGEIVRAWDSFSVEFEEQWGAFFRWLDTAYGPAPGNVMYDGANLGLSEESVALWEKHSREYVKHLLAQGTEGAETTPPAAPAAAPDPGEAASIVATFGAPHLGWVFVYADGRVISHEPRNEALPERARAGLVERRLTPAGLDLVRSGAVQPSRLLTERWPRGLPWADADFAGYWPSEYAIMWVDPLGHGYDPRERLLPEAAQGVLRGKAERTRELEIAADWECAKTDRMRYPVLSSEEATALREILLDAGWFGQWKIQTPAGDGHGIVQMPILPHGEYVAWCT